MHGYADATRHDAVIDGKISFNFTQFCQRNHLQNKEGMVPFLSKKTNRLTAHDCGSVCGMLFSANVDAMVCW